MSWVSEAIAKIKAEANRSADTHLFKVPVSGLPGIDIYLKDESTHPTGSLKHRLARSLFLYALCNGKLREDTPVIEASSGSTAVSEAYFAQLIGLRFIAVIPQSTAQKKIRLIKHFGGEVHFVDHASEVQDTATELSKTLGGHFMDQFTFAERATDWRGNNNIAESIFRQMAMERHPVPNYVVMSAGTGGTSATIGRYIRYAAHKTKLVVVDPEHSVFHASYLSGDRTLRIQHSSRIEGIGRPRVEPSFQPDVIDEMMKVTDRMSLAAMLWLEKVIGRRAGPSTGTNLCGAFDLAERLVSQKAEGSIVTLLCDDGERYCDTYYDAVWVNETFGPLDEECANLSRFGEGRRAC